MPIVSVLVPNYNHSKFLKQRIDSILNQTYQSFEIILLDDCSTDRSQKILKEYALHTKVAHLILNEENSGSPFGMWEKGINKAKGTYIWIAESDDWASLDFLEKLMYKIKNKKITVVHSQSNLVYGNKTKLNSWWNNLSDNLWTQDFIKKGEYLLSNYGVYKCPVINVSSAVFLKASLKNVTYPTNFRFCGDWWFWAQLFIQGNVAYVAEPLNFMRMHKASATTPNPRNNLERIKENFIVIQNISDLLNLKLKYHKNYEWLMKQWVSEIVNNRNYLKLNYYNLNVPFSFKILIFKLTINILFKRAQKKIML